MNAELTTYVTLMLMCGQAAMCLLKLAGRSIKVAACASVIWGIVGYCFVDMASNMGDLQYGMLSRFDLTMAVTFAECGVMIAYAVARSGRKPYAAVNRVLAAYPGISIVFPIMHVASGCVCYFTGVSFAKIGAVYASCLAAVIFIIVIILGRVRIIRDLNIELLYYCSIFTAFMGVIAYGAQN